MVAVHVNITFDAFLGKIEKKNLFHCCYEKKGMKSF
jgi:hypothetical protein